MRKLLQAFHFHTPLMILVLETPVHSYFSPRCIKKQIDPWHSGAKLHAVLPDSKNIEAEISKKI